MHCPDCGGVMGTLCKHVTGIPFIYLTETHYACDGCDKVFAEIIDTFEGKRSIVEDVGMLILGKGMAS